MRHARLVLLHYYPPLAMTLRLRKARIGKRNSDPKRDSDRRKLLLFFRLLLTITIIAVVIGRLRRRPRQESMTRAPAAPQPGEKPTAVSAPAPAPDMVTVKTPNLETLAVEETPFADMPAVEMPAQNAAGEDMPAPAAPAAAVVVGQDDLTLIEGIGPKVAALLNDAGIMTFQQLADADTGHLEELLRTAGLRMLNPGTWPQQARLAALADYDGLKVLQGQLKGGRRV